MMSSAASVGDIWRLATKSSLGLSQRSDVCERALGSLGQPQTWLSLVGLRGHGAPGLSLPYGPLPFPQDSYPALLPSKWHLAP